MPPMVTASPTQDFLSGLPRQPKVLVVDDQPMHIQVLYRALAPDCQVFMATGGEAALKLCAEKQPDLVLLDVEMPDVSGFDVLAQLKADIATRHLPVIFVTGHTSDEIESKCLEAGAVDFISKPINPRVVRSRVKTHLLLKFQSDLLRDMAFLDGLTGAFNRRYFDERLAMEWARSQRNGTPLSLIMLDVDFFKNYNDHYGHQAGDDALRLVVGSLKPQLQRPGDMLARYGGEEFVCLLPDTDFDQAMLVAQRLEERVRDQGLPHERSDASPVLTVSLGVATKPGFYPGESIDLLRVADAQLYLAKHQGKGRACGEALTG